MASNKPLLLLSLTVSMTQVYTWRLCESSDLLPFETEERKVSSSVSGPLEQVRPVESVEATHAVVAADEVVLKTDGNVQNEDPGSIGHSASVPPATATAGRSADN